MSKFYVGSEIGPLRTVLLHRPRLSLSRLTPSNCAELLFDDVLDVDKAGEEHDVFANTLRQEGVEVLLLSELLTDILEQPEAREFLLMHQVSDYRLGHGLARDIRMHLAELDARTLATYLIGGMTYAEFPLGSPSLLQQIKRPNDFILEPLPNHLFTRDTSCWIYGGVSINPMMKAARQRETYNLKAIYRYHPLFREANFETYLGGNGQTRYDNSFIEGGDVLVLGRGSVLVGMSERTTAQGVELLSRRLFASGQAREVIAVQLPSDRSCMHLDTVMTHMDVDKFSAYPAVIGQHTRCWRLTDAGSDQVNITEQKSIVHAIEKSLDIDMQIITTGGDAFQAEREQWNDANNVLTVRPGVVIAYEHNHYTNEAYDKAGITVLPIPGGELGKGRGGGRCMSCPLLRDEL